MMDVITGKTRPGQRRAFFGSTIDLLRLSEPEIAQVGHRPQVPEAHGVRAAQRLREPGAGLRSRPPRAAPACFTA
jgi:ABC-type uncharacterized transport system ATPase subunit